MQTPPPPPPWGRGPTFPEHGHVACQIKGNYKCSNVVANILSQTPLLPPTLGVGSRVGEWGQKVKNKLLRTWSCWISNYGKGSHECSNMVANILPADPPRPWGRAKGLHSTFSEHGHVSYQIQRESQMQQQGSKYFACRPHTSCYNTDLDITKSCCGSQIF